MELNSSNWEQVFKEHFFDVRKNAPKKGQVMACFTAGAELIEGDLKRDLIYLLATTSKVHESVLLLQKMGCAEEKDAIRICREIAEDLQSGKTKDEVMSKVYKYVLRVYYYTEPEYIPADDPHWNYVEIKNLDEFIEHSEKTKQGYTITSKIIKPEKQDNKDI